MTLKELREHIAKIPERRDALEVPALLFFKMIAAGLDKLARDLEAEAARLREAEERKQ